MKMMILVPFIALILNGCGASIEDEYAKFCNRQPESMSCIKHRQKGFAPEKEYLDAIERAMRSNFIYKTDQDQYGKEEYWFDNVTVSGKLVGDCDDISLTFISQLIIDGVSPDRIWFVVSGTDGEPRHFYVKVKMDDGTMFNFYGLSKYSDILYMPLDDVGNFNSRITDE